MVSTRPRLVAFTGAGVSAAAGLSTYRGSSGLWTLNPELETASSADGYRDDPQRVHTHLETMRAAANTAQPTRTHRALADIEQHADITIITQNIDGLHQRAGSSDVIELHGNIHRLRCSNRRCVGGRPTLDSTAAAVGNCDWCNKPLRHDVILFDEELSGVVWADATRAVQHADHIIIAGTSGSVWPARDLIDPGPRHAHITLINATHWEQPHRRRQHPNYRQHIGDVDTHIDNVLNDYIDTGGDATAN